MSLAKPPEGPRASDADRERVAEVLRDQLVKGRLDGDELAERLHLAYSARTVGELEVLTHDLPTPARMRAQNRRMTDLDRSFAIHFGIYMVLMIFFVLIWAITGGGSFWPIWPAMGWGVGVGIHGVVTAVARLAPEQEKPSNDGGVPRAASAPPAPSASRWVAVMFTDIAESTKLTEALGDSEWSRLRAKHRDMLRELFGAHGGTEVSAQGDGFLSRFPSPSQAARCAMAIQRKLEDARESAGFAPKVRIGIHAGEALEEGDGDVVGRAVNLASRVMSAAEPGEILITEPVADHLGAGFTLEDKGLQPLRGVPQPRHLLAVRW